MRRRFLGPSARKLIGVVMFRIKNFAFAGLAILLLMNTAQAESNGSVIFFHPDGTGLAHWDALRVHKVGPDGELNWDRVPRIAVYTGHVKDSLTPSSHAGATTHAYGVKVVRDSFGKDGHGRIVAASGKPMSVAEEALRAGKVVGLVQTGHIAQPGTAAFVASVNSRKERAEIARQVIESGVQVIMAGGEKFLLPEGVQGRHGSGARVDGLNLVERARELGYEIVYTRDELLRLDLSRVDKLLGVFASGSTFKGSQGVYRLLHRVVRNEGRIGNLVFSAARFLGAEGDPSVPTYLASAPTVSEMAEAALKVLARHDAGFLLVVEEEGTDNLANILDPRAQLEALSRADDAVGGMLRFVEERDDTLLLIAADSDANGTQIIPGDDFASKSTGSGASLPFSIGWASARGDVVGGVLVRAAGLNSELLPPLIDNTEIYRLIHVTLFGEESTFWPALSEDDVQNRYAHGRDGSITEE